MGVRLANGTTSEFLSESELIPSGREEGRTKMAGVRGGNSRGDGTRKRGGDEEGFKVLR